MPRGRPRRSRTLSRRLRSQRAFDVERRSRVELLGARANLTESDELAIEGYADRASDLIQVRGGVREVDERAEGGRHAETGVHLDLVRFDGAVVEDDSGVSPTETPRHRYVRAERVDLGQIVDRGGRFVRDDGTLAGPEPGAHD